MSAKMWALGWALVASSAVATADMALASDHADMSAKRKTDLAANYGPRDLADLYSWVGPDSSISATSPPKRAFLVLTVHPNAPKATAAFDTNTLYQFHTIAKGAFADTSDTASLDILCAFEPATTVASQKFECWSGEEEYVSGTGSATTGSGVAQSVSKNLRVWVGLANDPAFHNRAGFDSTITSIRNSLSGWNKDAAGCITGGLAAVDAATLRTKLSTPAADAYAGQNVLAIVVSADIDYLTIKRDPVTKKETKLPLLGVWASAKKRIPK